MTFIPGSALDSVLLPLPPKPLVSRFYILRISRRYQVFTCSSLPSTIYRDYRRTVGNQYSIALFMDPLILSKNRARCAVINEQASRIVCHFTRSIFRDLPASFVGKICCMDICIIPSNDDPVLYNDRLHSINN